MAKKPLILRINDKVKVVLKRNAIGGFIYRKILNPIWLAYRLPLARRRMRFHGYEMLDRMHQVFRKYRIPYYADCGSLLGFIRDGDFLKGDADMDVSVIPEYGSLANVLRVFLSEGYRYVYSYEYNGRLLEFTVMDPYVELTIDVFQSEYSPDDKATLIVRYLRWFQDRNYPSERDNTALEFRFPAPTGIKEITVHGITVDVPMNAEEILDAEYGPWRTPDPNFRSDMIPHEEAPLFAHRLSEEEAVSHA